MTNPPTRNARRTWMRLSDWIRAQAAASQKFLVQKHPAEFTWFSPVPFSVQEIELHSNDRKSPASPLRSSLTMRPLSRFQTSQWSVGSALEPLLSSTCTFPDTKVITLGKVCIFRAASFFKMQSFLLIFYYPVNMLISFFLILTGIAVPAH